MDASWREKLRYRVDTLLARGSTGPLIWLGGATALLTIIGALVFWAVGIQWGERDGPAEALWRSFIIAIGKGVIGDATWTQRVTTLIFIFASLFLAGSLVGLLVSAINRRLDDIRRGRSRVLERNHTLVLGNSARLMPVLDELIANRHNDAAVVVLSEQDKVELEDDLQARQGSAPRRRVVFRNGTPSRRADLDLVGVNQARSIIVLNSGSAVDAVTVRRALAANAFSEHNVHIVAEMSNQRIARSVRRSTRGQVATVGISATVADMLTQAVRAPGLARLFDELLSFDGNEFYIAKPGAVVGRSWLDVNAALVDAVPLGVITNNSLTLLPQHSRVIEPGDRIVVLGTSRSPQIAPHYRHLPQTGPTLTDSGAQSTRIMVLGWSPIGIQMMTELDGFLGDGATVTVLADESLMTEGFPSESDFEHRVRFRPTKHDPDDVRRAIDSFKPDVLVVLGYLSKLTEDEADALTLLTLHTLGDAAPQNHRPRIVAQMLNNEVGALAASGFADDYVVTDALVSRMLVHLARDRELAAVFDDLFDAKGPSARLLTCGAAAPDHHRWGDLRMLVLERNMVLLGFIEDGQVRLNPHTDDVVSLKADDRLIVLGRF